MPSIVITGASGFFGAHLRVRFSHMGVDVIPVSRRSIPGGIKVDDYASSPLGDTLIHLAEESDRSLVNQAGEDYVVNSARTITGLVSRSYKRIIYVSSSTVYGDASSIPRKVGDEVYGKDIYNQGKLTCEKIVLDSGGSVVRLTNIFGAGMSKKSVISEIIEQLPNSGPILIRNDLSVRDYIHVSDATEALALFSMSDYSGLINVGTGVGTSVRGLIEVLVAAAGQSGREITVTAPHLRLSTNIVDISKTTEIINWYPQKDLGQELKNLVCAKEKPSYE